MPSALKREHPAPQKRKLIKFLYFASYFCPHGSGPIRIRIHNTGSRNIRNERFVVQKVRVVIFYIKQILLVLFWSISVDCLLFGIVITL
jgi:hypothetical protein